MFTLGGWISCLSCPSVAQNDPQATSSRCRLVSGLTLTEGPVLTPAQAAEDKQRQGLALSSCESAGRWTKLR